MFNDHVKEYFESLQNLKKHVACVGKNVEVITNWIFT